MPIVKKRPMAILAAIIGMLMLWQKMRQPDEGAKRLSPDGRRVDDSVVRVIPTDVASQGRATKAGDRQENHRQPATHSPARLRDFYLPAVEIDGLPLVAALGKLFATYDRVCRNTGESPVRLTFSVPPAHDRPLTLKLTPRTVDSAIRLLAAVSGLKVVRKGSEYVFKAPAETGQARKRSLQVPLDFPSRRRAKGDPFAAPVELPRLTPEQYFAASGLMLDPATRFKCDSSQATLTIETSSAADELAVTSPLKVVANERPLQHLIESRIIELSPDIAWTPPDVSQLDDAQMLAVLRELSRLKGVNLMTPAPITIRAGERRGGTIEIGSDFIFPLETGGYESRFTGIQMQPGAEPVGFGQNVSLRYTNTVADLDPESGIPSFTEKSNVSDLSFANDGAARLHLQTRPDGARTLLLVKPTLVDATGRPARSVE